MTRLIFSYAAWLVAILGGALAQAGPSDAIISEPVAAAHGLKRAWVVQMDAASGRSRLQFITLNRGVLFAQTDRGILQAFSAETGKPLWASSKQIGSPTHPTMRMAANEKVVAVVNGSRLYVLNRANGETLLERTIDGAPSAGVAMSDNHVYVPTFSGLVLAYRLKPLTEAGKTIGAAKAKPTVAETDEAAPAEDYRLSQDYTPPLACQSLGRCLVRPIVTRVSDDQEFVIWPTDAGVLFAGQLANDRFKVRYRVETKAEIVTEPLFLAPNPDVVGDSGVVIVTSRDGYVQAISDAQGELLWRLPVGEPVVQNPALIGNRLYVTTQLGGLFCLDARSGRQIWWSPNVAQFLSASKDRLYAADKLNQMLVLDVRTGNRIDTFSLADLPLRLANIQSDRIFLASPWGTIQCLHEPQLAQPLNYVVAVKATAAEKAGATAKKSKPAEPKAGAGEEAPAAKPAAAKPAAAAPKKPAGAPPKGKKGADKAGGEAENPFGAAPPAAKKKD